MARKSSTKGGDLFIGESGQLRLADKSAEQQTMENRKVECLGMTFANEDERRRHFLEKLKERLADPEFRKTPGFPKGGDDDILRFSDPPYFTLCPNPFIADFLAHNGTSGGSAQQHAAFSDDVRGSKHGSAYNVHPYHTKVPPEAIEPLIRHYTSPGDVVLDPFAGTGMTGVAVETVNGDPGGAPVRTAILSDLSPAAVFIAGNYTRPGDGHAAVAVSQVLKEAESTVGRYFRTQHSGWPAQIRSESEARQARVKKPSDVGEVIYTVWSDVYRCPECTAEFAFWDAAVRLFDCEVQEIFACPRCNKSLCKEPKFQKDGASLIERATEAWFDPCLRGQATRQKRKPCLISYEVRGKRFEKLPDDADLALILEADGIKPLLDPMPMLGKGSDWGDTWRAGVHTGISHVHQFFTNRTLLVLSSLRHNKAFEPAVAFLATSAMLRLSRLNRYMPQHRDNRNREVVGPLSGTLYVPSISLELNPIYYLRTKERAIRQLADRHGRAQAMAGVASATSLSSIPDASIDYVFTDPPFGDNLFYSELNQQWEWFLGVVTDRKEEAVVAESQGKRIREYGQLMADALKECHRVLRPGRWLTMEFHNSKNAVWAAIQDAMSSAGLVIADVRVLDKQKGTTKQLTFANAVMKDLLISAYRPSESLEKVTAHGASEPAAMWAFVREHLGQVAMPRTTAGLVEAVAERQAHMLFDRMVAFFVRRGVSVPLSAAEFYSGLEQHYPVRDGMYFLHEQVTAYDKMVVASEGVGQLELFVVDEASAIQWLRRELSKKPQTFQELQPQFMREAQSWAKHEETVELREMLDQGFLVYDGIDPVPSQVHAYLSSNFKELRNKSKDDRELREKAKGRWYVPDAAKQADLEKLRERALLREFEQYRDAKSKRLKLFRTEALRVGFKSAYDSQDYRTIVDVAGRLPESILQEDEKLLLYYDVASMRLGEE